MKNFALAVIAALLASGCAGWQPNKDGDLMDNVQSALSRFQEERGDELKPYFDEAYGYAVLPVIRKGGLVFAGGGGEGIVFEQGEATHYVQMRRFGLGAQAGWQKQAQIIFFRDKAAYDNFTDGTTVEFTPQASRTWGKGGGVADGHFATSVAVFSLSAGGAMLEAAASGSKFKFRPID